MYVSETRYRDVLITLKYNCTFNINTANNVDVIYLLNLESIEWKGQEIQNQKSKVKNVYLKHHENKDKIHRILLTGDQIHLKDWHEWDSKS